MTGRRYERQLVNLLDDEGFAIMKSPSSGSGTSRDQPDLLAGHADSGTVIAVEAKTTEKNAYTVRKDEADQLRRFAEAFGATPVVAMYWKRPNSGGKDYGGWWFERLGGVRRSPVANKSGDKNLRPRREDREAWASIGGLTDGRFRMGDSA